MEAPVGRISSRRKSINLGPRIPEPYTGSQREKVYSLEDLPTSDDLEKVLNESGINTSEWGKGNTKEVSKFWKEIKLDEAGLEIWRKPDGTQFVVRVTHVLRAKVTSEENYERGIFLFNTWQQYGDGRKRTRNGLLSEKLAMSEMPLELHLHQVCQRAVTEEEMQRVVDSDTVITNTSPAPKFDPAYKCPLDVVDEAYTDHSIEIEASKSYPGLLTIYHLYTVDIVCTGLPKLNFNTLEFAEPEKDGTRKLKYIHAWVWSKWESIQRYLLEGSALKERVVKDTFSTVYVFKEWLEQFSIDFEVWGTEGYRSVEDLFDEVQKEQTQLEHWGRQDGVPILMRVVHVLQLKLTSLEKGDQDYFMLQESKLKPGGVSVPSNRLLAKKMDFATLPPYTHKFFFEQCKAALMETFEAIADVHFYVDPDKPPMRKDFEPAQIKLLDARFDTYRYNLEASPSYKDMVTMYHLYTVFAVCDGFPAQDFASLSFRKNSVDASVWRWVTWQHTMDMVHARAGTLLERDTKKVHKISKISDRSSHCTDKMQELLQRISKKSKDPDVRELQEILNTLEEEVKRPLEELTLQGGAETVSATDRLPPSIVSTLAEQKHVSDEFLQEVGKRRNSLRMQGFDFKTPGNGGSSEPGIALDGPGEDKDISSGGGFFQSLFCSATACRGESVD